MIAPIRQRRSRSSTPAWHAGFMAMLPKIVRHARVILPRLRAEARASALQEVVSNATVAYARLAELGKEEVAYPTVLANFAVAQYKSGRRVGNRLNINDITSSYAQKMRGIVVARLDHYDEQEGTWKEVLVEDRHTTPAEVARVRIDFRDWLRTLSRRDRKIALTLATGETTGTTARKFSLCDGRISQLRGEFHDSWLEFQGEEPTTEREMVLA